MNPNRRQVLAAGLTAPLLHRFPSHPATPPAKSLLVLGGTRFLGPPIVRAALEAGWDVTLFNRGKSNPELFPKLQQIDGDRDAGTLDGLKGRKWDVVIDTSGYAPVHVQQVCELLRDHVAHYVFVSTISVYADTSPANVDENARTQSATVEKIAATKTIQQAMADYGAMKAECERAAEKAMPGRVTVVRPGLIVGPEDSSDRFTYWPVRVQRGGEVLAPGEPDGEVQFVDVRDCGRFCFDLAAASKLGTFNCAGFTGRVSFAELLHGCKITLNTETTFTWVGEEFLQQNKVRAYRDMPMWLPRGMRGHIDNRRAIAAGLRFRSIAETIRDTVEWHRTRPADHQWRAGITAERERELLAKWRAAAAK